MKAILPFAPVIFAMVFFWQCEKDPVPEIVVSDNMFLQALIAEGVDKDQNGKISPEEAESIRALDIRENNISDLSGIESFEGTITY